jgi:hypothetical protein
MHEILLALDRSKASRPLTTDGGATPPGRDCAPAISAVRRMTRGSVRVMVRELFEGVDMASCERDTLERAFLTVELGDDSEPGIVRTETGHRGHDDANESFICKRISPLRHRQTPVALHSFASISIRHHLLHHLLGLSVAAATCT